MNGDRRKQLLLVAILVALGLALVFRLRGSEPGSDPGSVGAEPRSALAALRALPPVPWERLDAATARYNPKGRNLFQFGRVEPPPPTPEEIEAMHRAKEAEEEIRRKRQEGLEKQQALAQLRLEEQRQRLALAQRNPVQTAAQVPAGPPPPPAPAFKFIGYLGPAEDKIAVLLEGEDFYLGRVGEVVQDRFRIVDIGYEWVQVGYTDPVYRDQTRRILMGQ